MAFSPAARSVRVFSDAAVAVHPGVVGRRLAPPGRRFAAFACDLLVVIVPSIVLAYGAAAISLAVTDPDGFRAISDVLSASSGDPQAVRLGRLAPLLVRMRAEGLPPGVVAAVEASDLTRAGEILSDYTLDLTLGGGAPAPGKIRIDVDRFVPALLRWASTFGVGAAYFTIFAWGRRRSTPGKRLFGIEVMKIDGRPLTLWESFERFGGYFISVGTFGLGLLDLRRDPNRRLAHDRVSNTVVVMRALPARVEAARGAR